MKNCIKKITIILLIILTCISCIANPLTHVVKAAGEPTVIESGDSYTLGYERDIIFNNITYRHYLQGRGPWRSNYFQWSNVAGSGCSITSAASIIYAYGYHDVTPETIRAKNPEPGDNKSGNLINQLNAYGLTGRTISSNFVQEIRQAFSEGKPVIARIRANSSSQWGTSAGHYLPIIGEYNGNLYTLNPSSSGGYIVPNGLETLCQYLNSWGAWIPDNPPTGAVVTNGGTATGGWTISDDVINLDNLEFEYNGKPKQVFNEGKRNLIEWIFSSLGKFIDYLLGIVFSIIKMAFVGIAELIENGVSDLLLSAENTPDQKQDNKQIRYTIEDLVYNRIPILDVNIFTVTAGGKQIAEGSAVQIIRNLIAIWYVSLRNFSIVAMLLALIVQGIRMAFTTSASKKAKYKEDLLKWVKAFALLFILHYIVYFILLLNSTLVSTFAISETGENTIYNTIKTRAYDLRFSVGFPGTIMYLTLFIFWLRFVWIYLKRFFKVLILIIVSPIVILKYAFSSSVNKREFGNWLSDFISNVIIQAAHALEYSVFFGIAIEIAQASITGFIVALVFMSQMLKMDDILLSLIKFHGSDSSRVKPLKEGPVQALTRFATAVYAPILVTKGAIGFTKGVGGLAYGVGKLATSGYDQYSQKEYGTKPFEERRKKKEEKRNIRKDNFDNFIIRHSKEAKTGEKSLGAEMARLRINSRRGGKIGAISRAKLNNYKKGQKKIFTSKAGAISKIVGGITAGMYSVPFMANDMEEYGIPMGMAAPGVIISGINDIGKERKKGKLKEQDDELKDTVAMVNEANELTSDTEAEIYNINDKERAERAYNEIDRFEKIKSNNKFLEEEISQLLHDNPTLRMKYSRGEIKELLEKAMDDADKDGLLSKEEKENIVNKVTIDIKNRGENAGFSIEDISDSFGNALMDETVSKENHFIAQNINKLKDINDISNEKDGGSISRTNMFTLELKDRLDTLNKDNNE